MRLSRRVGFTLLFATTVLALLGAEAARGELFGRRERHPWGRFAAGAWKKVRVHTQHFDEQRQVAAESMVESTTTLVSSDAGMYTLRIEVAVEAAGRRFPASTRLVTQRFDGETPSTRLEVETLPPTTLDVGGKPFTCQVQKLVAVDADLERTSLVFYTEEVEPSILRRQTTTVRRATKAVVSQTDVRVVDLAPPLDSVWKDEPGWQVETVERTPAGAARTREIYLRDVPGGVVANATERFDAGGQLVVRSELECLEMGDDARRPRGLRAWISRRREARARPE